MIKSLTSLRFFFIIAIFLHHCRGYVGGGSMGVAFFFVLGGFCMVLGYKDKVTRNDFKYGRYLTKRAIKFYPLHWMCFLAVILLALLTDETVTGWGNIPALFLNFSLLHSWVPLKEVYFSFNSVSWYLADTIFFASVFPLLFNWIVKTSNFGRIAVSSLFVLAYAVVAICIPSSYRHALLYINPIFRLLDFVFGVFLALGYFSIKELRWINVFFRNGTINLCILVFLIVLLVLESVCLGDFQLIAPVYWPLIALIILTASLSNQSGGLFSLLENKYLVLLGESSFTFFMIHTIVMKFLKIDIHGAIVLYFLMTIVLSIMIDYYIISPLTKWLTKKIQPSTTVRS